MNKLLIPILFAMGTAVFWGCYGPTLGNAQAPSVDGVPAWSAFKPYVFIGIAYLVIAIAGGLVMMKIQGDSFNYSGQHFDTAKWGFLAGTLGAFGAFCLTSAMMNSRGNALLVMPIVFGGAVSVTAMVSVVLLRGQAMIKPLLWFGMVLTVIGVVVVASYTPGHEAAQADDFFKQTLIPIFFAMGTAFFWGCYGPTIGNAQAPRVNGKPLWSPFKPYVFIGIAYLVIAIAGGLLMMNVQNDSFSYSGTYFPAAQWGFLAGTLGAFGALCLTTAMMTSKGNALLVMPIVFGGAVSVTAVVSVLRLHDGDTIDMMLWVGMALTVAGVVVVATNTPHGHAPSPAPAETARVESATTPTPESAN